MKTFAKIFLIISSALTIISCSTLRLTPEEKQAIADDIQTSVEAKDYEVRIDMMNPLRGRSRHVTGFSVKVKEGTLFSNLPYLGVARSLPYGGGSGLTFESEITSYSQTRVDEDHYEISLTTTNEDEDLTYKFDIYTNGKAYLSVFSDNRDSISYSGEISIND